MFFTFGLLVAARVKVTGWGLATVALVRRLGIRSPYRFDVVTPIVGIVTLTALVNLTNFVYPVGYFFALLVVGLGWLGLVLALPRLLPLLRKPLWVIFVIVWLGILSTHAVLQAWNYDSGLYHIPAIRWIIDSAIPFGLANLHGRLGFNSAWFSVSALLAEATGTYAANYTAIASETLFAAFGIAVLVALYKFFRDKTVDLATLFLILSGTLGFAPIVVQNVSSPSTDHPVIILALVLFYVFLRGVAANETADYLYEFWLAVLLASFIVIIKISMLPLVLVPGLLLFVGYRKGLMPQRWLAWVPIAGTGAVLLGPWLARRIVLAGCLVYPISVTCVWGLPWAVTRGQAESETLWIVSWARAPRVPPEKVMASWNWVGPWLGRLTASLDFILPLVWVGLGLVLILLTRRYLKGKPELRYALLLILVVLVGGIYWFGTAPDLRFGASWFWDIGILVLSVALLGVAAVPNGSRILKFALVVLLIGASISVANVGVGYVQRATWTIQSTFYMIPPMPKAAAVVQTTNHGLRVNVVAEARCYWTPEPCTPYYEEDLRVERVLDNRYLFGLTYWIDPSARGRNSTP